MELGTVIILVVGVCALWSASASLEDIADELAKIRRMMDVELDD